MPRTELYRKFAEQIEAIKSVAQANERVAEVLDERAHLAKFVIDLVKGISCFKAISGKSCGQIKFGELDPSAQLAYTVLGFQTEEGRENDLITLCARIEREPNPTQNCPPSTQIVTATSKSEPTGSPTTTPPPGKGLGKKE